MSESVIIKKSRVSPSLRVNDNSTIKPNYVLLFLIFLIPLQNIYISKLPSLGGGLNLLNICFLMAFLVWKMRSDLNEKTITNLNTPLLFFAASYFFALAMHWYSMGELPFHIVTMVKDILLGPFLFFITLNSVRDRRGILYATIATILPMIYMFRVFFSQHINVSSYHYDDDLRISGTFSQLGSNEIATFYATYTFILIMLFYYFKETKVRLVLGFVIGLNLYSLIYSYSRGAYVGFVIGLFSIVWIMRKKLIFILIPITIVFGGVIINFLPASVQERVGTIFVEKESDRDESAESRFVFWGLAIQQFSENPIVGKGYLTFIQFNPSHLDTHNYYLKLLAENGIIGFLIFIVILWRSSKSARNIYNESNDPLYKALGIGFFGALISFVIGNIFGDRFTHYPLSAYFYVYLALILRALILTREESPTKGIILKKT